jgi:hypothetical protein
MTDELLLTRDPSPSSTLPKDSFFSAIGVQSLISLLLFTSTSFASRVPPLQSKKLRNSNPNRSLKTPFFSDYPQGGIVQVNMSPSISQDGIKIQSYVLLAAQCSMLLTREIPQQHSLTGRNPMATSCSKAHISSHSKILSSR